MGSRSSHKKALEKIKAHPEKFDFIGFELNHIRSISIEPTLYYKGRIMAEPDILIETVRNAALVIEYKGKGNGELLDRARKQLENALWWYGRCRPDIDRENIRTLIVSGDDPKYKDLLR